MHSHERPFLALGLRLMAQVMVSIMLLLVKVAGQHHVGLAETLFWRQFVPAVVIAGWLAARGQTGRLRTARPMLHARRAVIGMLTMVMVLGAVQVLPLAEATVLSFTTPIFAVMLSVMLLREHVGPVRWAAVVLGLIGVVVIAGPDRGHLPLLGIALGLGAAFGAALVAIQLRDMGRTEEPLTIVFWFSALGALMLSPSLLFADWQASRDGWLLLVGIGLSGMFGQILLTAALRFGSVGSVIVMDYSSLVWATLWGWLVFSQLPPAATWFGAPLVIAAGLVIFWREHRRTRPAASGYLPAATPIDCR